MTICALFVKIVQNLIPTFFWNCAEINSLWQEIIEYFELEELRNAVWQDIHVGIEGTSHRIKMCNTVIFITKYMIYKARSESIIPSFAQNAHSKSGG